MSARTFKSFPRQPTEAEIVAIARQLLEAHAASREAATQACNLQGAHGTPPDRMTSLPALEPVDHARLDQLGQLLQGAHGTAVLAVIREYMPDVFRSAGAPHERPPARTRDGGARD